MSSNKPNTKRSRSTQATEEAFPDSTPSDENFGEASDEIGLGGVADEVQSDQEQADAEAAAAQEQADAEAKAKADQEQADAEAKAKADQEQADADAKAKANREKSDAKSKTKAKKAKADAKAKADQQRDKIKASTSSEDQKPQQKEERKPSCKKCVEFLAITEPRKYQDIDPATGKLAYFSEELLQCTTCDRRRWSRKLVAAAS